MYSKSVILIAFIYFLKKETVTNIPVDPHPPPYPFI